MLLPTLSAGTNPVAWEADRAISGQQSGIRITHPASKEAPLFLEGTTTPNFLLRDVLRGKKQQKMSQA